MKVAGFTFIRNAVKYDYPVVESIMSLLPLCDELIVNIGDSEDSTEELIRSINSEKIKIFHSVWDHSLKEGGRVLAVETNKALANVSADTDWCIYLQADELLHEKHYDVIREAMSLYKDDPKVDGLLLKYKHFYGSYDYIGDSRKWYSHEIRVIKNDKNILSYRDAQGFRKNGNKLQVKLIDAYVFHYGWVKHPSLQMQKIMGFEKLYNEDNMSNKISKEQTAAFDYSGIDSLTWFMGTHPQVIHKRISQQNWQFQHNITRKNFSIKGRLLHWIEKLTGKRLFDYKNYKIIR